MDVGDKVGALLEIGYNMRGKQDAALPVRDRVAENVQKLVAAHRVKAACRLVEKEEPRPVREGERQRELDPHAGGQLAHAFRLVEREALHVFAVRGVVPMLIKPRRRLRHIAQAL